MVMVCDISALKAMAKSQFECCPIVSETTINEMLSYHLYSLTTLKVDKIKASWLKMDFYDFCL